LPLTHTIHSFEKPKNRNRRGPGIRLLGRPYVSRYIQFLWRWVASIIESFLVFLAIPVPACYYWNWDIWLYIGTFWVKTLVVRKSFRGMYVHCKCTWSIYGDYTGQMLYKIWTTAHKMKYTLFPVIFMVILGSCYCENPLKLWKMEYTLSLWVKIIKIIGIRW
jgi:hypothetical protein